MALVTCLAWGVSAARGGTYEVVACDHAPGGAHGSWTAEASDPKMWTGHACPTAGGEAAGLFAGSGVNVGTINAFAASQWYFDSPPGTSIVFLNARYIFRRYEAYWRLGLFASKQGQQLQMLHGCEPGGDAFCTYKTGVDSTWGWLPGHIDHLAIVTACGSPTGCRSDAAAPSGDRAGVRLYAATVRIHDETLPEMVNTGTGSLTSGGWQRGTRQIGYAGSDNVGIRMTRLWIDGQALRDDPRGCDYSRRKPCPDIAPDSYSVNTSGLADGRHEVKVEGVDAAGNSGWYAAAFESDNTAPGQPLDVALESGDGWRQTNRFKLTWRNPPSASPVTAVHYELCNVASKACTTGSRSGNGITTISDLAVPAPGHYTVKLWLQDQAGNVSPANTSERVNLRFDDVPPGQAEPVGRSDWLNAAEAANYGQAIRLAPGATVPVSGIGGYSVTVNGQDPDANLETAGPTYRLTSLPEGVTVFKARSISGSRVPSALVGSTTIRVDRSPPAASVEGAPDPASWSREPVGLRLSGIDQSHLSGMIPAPAHQPLEDGAFMAFRLDGGEERRARGGSSQASFPEDGEHTVAFAAVDAAGNRSPERAVSFKIDRTPPELVVFEAQDESDPRRLVVAVSDRTSGVAGAAIEMRRLQGGSDARWIELPVTREGDRFVAAVDDESLERGAYQLRARAIDRAGNEAIGERRRDGSPATVDTATLRGASRLTAGLVTRSTTKTKKVCPKKKPGEKRKCRKKKVKTPGGATVQSLAVAFGKQALSTGVLEAENGSPLADAVVDVYAKSAAAGSEYARIAAVRTDPKGAFSYTVPAGASRAVQFRYDGSSRHRSSDAGVTVKVAAASTIAVGPKRVRNGQQVLFRGKLRSQPIPSAGKVLDLQAHYRGKWRTFATPRAQANGKWSYRYRFGATRGTVPYRFRALIRPESAYPYDLGYSPTVTVVVRGR